MNTSWNADIHLISTYCFLSTEETKIFAATDQVYLVKDVFEYNFEDIATTSKLDLTSSGMVSSWMWFLQRNDVNDRNEWSNYTNLPYIGLNYDLVYHNDHTTPNTYDSSILYNPGYDPIDNAITGIATTGNYKNWFISEIMQTMAIVLNGDYRENILTSSVYNFIEKYTRTQGFAEKGIYCYNFCLNTSPFDYQPCGAINFNKFKDIQLEITTIKPPLSNKNLTIICDNNGNPIGVNQNISNVYDYNYRLMLFEERYNILSFISGNSGMLYAR
jgi:hypothetical protein